MSFDIRMCAMALELLTSVHNPGPSKEIPQRAGHLTGLQCQAHPLAYADAYLVKEVHQETVGFHLVLQLVQNDQ